MRNWDMRGREGIEAIEMVSDRGRVKSTKGSFGPFFSIPVFLHGRNLYEVE